MKSFSILITLLVWLTSGTVLAADFPDISPQQLKSRLDAGEKLTVIDALPPLLHQTKHLPGSMNIPASHVKAELPAKIPDKNAPLVFYCMGPKCLYTIQGAKAASELGYTNITTYKEGLSGWEKAGFPLQSTLTLPNDPVKQLSPEEFATAQKTSWLVDVRDEERSTTGIIRGTNQHLSILNIMKDFETLPKDKLIVLYDTSDQLTLICGRFLASKGYKVARLGGGITKWIGAGQPVDTVP